MRPSVSARSPTRPSAKRVAASSGSFVPPYRSRSYAEAGSPRPTTTSYASSGPRRVPVAQTAMTAARPHEGLEGERLDDRADEGAGLARAGRADGQQGGPEQVGVQGQSGPAAGVRIALPVLDRAEQHLPPEQVVPGRADGEVAGVGGVDAGRRAVRADLVGEGGEPGGVGAYGLPGAADPGVVDVVHPPVPHLGGEPRGDLPLPGGPQLGPLGEVVLGARRGGGGRGVLGAGAEEAAGEPGPAAEAAEDDEHHDDHQCVVDLEGGLARGGPRPGVGGEREKRPDPDAAEVAVVDQRPEQHSREE